MTGSVEQACADITESGFAIIPGVFDSSTVGRLHDAYWTARTHCERFQSKYDTASDQANTVHHVLFLDPIFAEVLERDDVMAPVHAFFSTDRVVLNSIGGNNNTGAYNYAAAIHRDVRFHTSEAFMLNSIIAVSPLSQEVGATQIMLGSEDQADPPSESDFSASAISIECPAGSMIYFDSRLWHRAGQPSVDVKERIIFTPIFTRPFIKPGFDYASQAAAHDPSTLSERMLQLTGYYSDIPKTHDDWYGFRSRRFYQKDQDKW